ncbi:MAG TPA: YncE family protein [Thermoplasmata archaeon]|nr:YncE family protein [Thermoplasmata archaeon]
MKRFAGRRVRASRCLLWGSIGLLGLAGLAVLLSSGGLLAVAGAPTLGALAGNAPGQLVVVAGATPAPGTAPTFTPSVTEPAADPIAPQVFTSVPVGQAPGMAAYDPQNGYVYVTNLNSANISVLDGTAVVGTISLEPNGTGSPDYVVYDPVNTLVYVVDRYNAEGSTGAVSVIYGTAVTSTVNVGVLPNSAAVDPASGAVYVTNAGGSAVTVLMGNVSVASVPTGNHPWAAAYDPLNGYVYVANNGTANVSVVSGLSDLGAVPVGTGPDAVAYDPADAEVYVANYATDNVSVLSGLTLAGTVGVGAGPSFVGYDAQNGSIVVANSAGANLTALNGTTVVVSPTVGLGPVWAAFGPAGGFGYAVNTLDGTVSVLIALEPFATVPVGSLPTMALRDPATGAVYVVNSGTNNVSVLEPAYQVAFNETGLPSGATWGVTLGAAGLASTGSSISFYQLPGTYPYAIAPPTGYAVVSATPASPVTVSNANVTVDVVFGTVGTGGSYTLLFEETGLNGMCQRTATWSVTVGNRTISSNGESIAFSEPNGTYNYSIGAPSGYSVQSSTPASPVTIAGAGVTVSVVFTHCGQSQPSTATITFEESGLPRGTSWCVELNGNTVCSTNNEIRFSGLGSGSYSFVVGSVTGYTANPSSGTIHLNGRDVTQPIRFSAQGGHHCGGGGGMLPS